MPYGDTTTYRGTEQREIGSLAITDEPDHKERVRIAHCDNGRAVSLDIRMFVDSQRGRNGGYKGPTKQGLTFFGKEVVTFLAQMRLAEEEFEIEEEAIQEEVERIRNARG